EIVHYAVGIRAQHCRRAAARQAQEQIGEVIPGECAVEHKRSEIVPADKFRQPGAKSDAAQLGAELQGVPVTNPGQRVRDLVVSAFFKLIAPVSDAGKSGGSAELERRKSS